MNDFPGLFCQHPLCLDQVGSQGQSLLPWNPAQPSLHLKLEANYTTNNSNMQQKPFLLQFMFMSALFVGMYVTGENLRNRVYCNLCLKILHFGEFFAICNDIFPINLNTHVL